MAGARVPEIRTPGVFRWSQRACDFQISEFGTSAGNYANGRTFERIRDKFVLFECPKKTVNFFVVIFFVPRGNCAVAVCVEFVSFCRRGPFDDDRIEMVELLAYYEERSSS
jgi:hypothetical protein